MPENSVKIILEAINKAEPAFQQLADAIRAVGKESEGVGATTKKTTSSIGSLFQTLKSHWLEFAAAGASIYGVIKSLQAFLRAAGEPEQITSRMAFQIRATGIEYANVKGPVEAFANSVQKATRFSSELAEQGLGQIMQYTDDLARGMQGVKLAMDVSTQTGMDLASAIKIVGFAMEGNIEMVRIAIPQLKQLDAVLGMNASKADKAALSMRILNEMFGGAAQHDIETYAGKMAQMNNTIADIKRGIGEKILGAIDWVKQEEFFQEWWAGVDSLLGITKRKIAETTKTEDANAVIKAEQEKVAAAKRGYEEQTKYYSLLEEVNIAYQMLNVTSTEALTAMVEKNIWAVEKIKQGWQEGKASVLSYQNALKAATSSMKAAIGEDPTKQLTDLYKGYEEQAKKIREEGGDDFRKKIEKLAAVTEEARKKIQEPFEVNIAGFEAEFREVNERFNQQASIWKIKADDDTLFNSIMSPWEDAKSIIEVTPIEPVADTTDFKTTINDAYMEIKRIIEGQPINVKVNVNSSGSGDYVDTNMGRMLGSEADKNFDVKLKFYGEASPKKPLSETIKDIIGQFGSLQNVINGLGTTINLREIGLGIKQAEREMERYNDVYWGYMALWSNPYASADTKLYGIAPSAWKTLSYFMEEVQGRLDILKMKQQLETLKMIEGSYQTGMPYVPKTGLYMLHKGEQVRTTNQVSMGGVTLNVTIPGAGDANDVADKLLKVFKYHLKGELKDLIS
jgi:hypothetical protein